MSYVFSMTSRMVTIALACALLLCVLLFLLGVEIGARFVASPAPAPVHTVSPWSMPPSAQSAPDPSASAPAASDPVHASSTN